MNARDIIISPVITEKTMTDLLPLNKYTFEVDVRANKSQIRDAIEELFGVKVVAVNTMRCRGKLRRMGRFQGRRPERKKAIVTLREGDSIEIFEGL
ncbi:MAG: 50S ribosomal protein L23 [Firmicutes bacterium]|jgi:large subunit ribosomal protein L23|nr:50S ribosomal protein L23 [Bacillota bacterium]